MSFTDKPTRFLGYGSAFGESARPLIDNDILSAFYTIGALFIIAHCVVVMIDSGNILAVIDTLIFELLASALIPTLVANIVFKLSNDLLDRFRATRDIRDYAPTFFCILILIVLCDPLDGAVNTVMDMSVRKILK